MQPKASGRAMGPITPSPIEYPVMKTRATPSFNRLQMLPHHHSAKSSRGTRNANSRHNVVTRKTLCMTKHNAVLIAPHRAVAGARRISPDDSTTIKLNQTLEGAHVRRRSSHAPIRACDCCRQ
jgi:hypothetical protein